MRIHIFMTLLTTLFLLGGCDQDGINDCHWYLVPEPLNQKQAAAGMVAVCARNYVTNKQRCRLQAKLEFAKKVYGKKFKLTELEIEKSGPFPRTVNSLKPCGQ